MQNIRVGLFIYLICLSKWAAGQDSAALQGVIRDNNKPLYATVHLKNSNRAVLSDSTGFFQINGLQKGRYTLHITSAGMEPYYLNLDLAENEVKDVTINMKPVSVALNEVVVTGTMKPMQRLNSPVAVEVYTPQFFRKNPTPSIFESLQMVNGVRPQINCSVCNTGDIHINGLEGPYTMITIDGMPIISSLASVYGLFGIPNQLIERVEVIKGPASGLYGSEAIGGLINIITKNPDKAPLFSLNVMSTSWAEHTLDMGVKKQWQKASSLLGLHYYRYQDPRDYNNDGFTDVTLQHRVSVFNKWNFKRHQNRIASLAGRYFYEDRWGGETQWSSAFRGTDSIYGESIYTSRWEIIGNYQLPVRQHMFLSFSGSGHHQNSVYGTTPYLGDQKIGFSQFIWNKKINDKYSFLLGAAGRYNYYDDNSTATRDTLSGRNMPEKVFLPGLFLQNEWEPNANHHLLVGLRYDYHKAHGAILTPRLAYKWRLNERQVFRINAGTGFRVVNLFTEDHAALTGSRSVEIKEKLRPEKSYNINGNYTLQLGTSSRPFMVDVSAWYTYFHNQIIADYDTDPRKIVYDNLGGYSLSKGVSVNMEFNWLQRLKGTAGITLQDISTMEEKGNKEIKKQPVLTERVSGTWAITYTFPVNGITIDYTGNVYGPMRLPLLSDKDPRSEYSPWWTIQNIQGTKWLSEQWEIFGGIKNLLNWTPARHTPFLIARAHDPFNKKVLFENNGQVKETPENPYKLTFDPSYVYAPNQGIRFFAGLKFKVK